MYSFNKNKICFDGSYSIAKVRPTNLWKYINKEAYSSPKKCNNIEIYFRGEQTSMERAKVSCIVKP